MEVALTKISQNGQVVIPVEIRKEGHIKPFTKFIVFNNGGNILLKQINKQALAKDMELIQKISQSESQIQSGKCLKVSSKMSAKDIDNLLMS